MTIPKLKIQTENKADTSLDAVIQPRTPHVAGSIFEWDQKYCKNQTEESELCMRVPVFNS